jgi:predicted nucleotidyltransferase/HEPN domain-containing protein
MKNDLDHLPASRRKHLAHIIAVLRDEVEQVTGFAHGKKKHSRILKIILFGSHATGKWVNDPAHGYVSDYDILVILNRRELVEEYKIWDTAEDRIALRVRPPLNILVHPLEEVNHALVEGQYFFTDIKREGIVLYESDKRELAEAGNLSAEAYKIIAEKHYNHWFESAKEFFDQYQYAFGKKALKIAAFQLHQSTERFYSCLLLVLSNYKPDTHNLVQLNALAILQDESITEVFPQNKKIYRRRFQLLKRAYIDARYSEQYTISQEELVWLSERVQVLQDLTKKLCQEKIKCFKS